MESLTEVCECVSICECACTCVSVCQSKRVGDRGEYVCPQYGRKKSNIISCSHEQIIPPLVRGVIDPSIIQNVNRRIWTHWRKATFTTAAEGKKTET